MGANIGLLSTFVLTINLIGCLVHSKVLTSHSRSIILSTAQEQIKTIDSIAGTLAEHLKLLQGHKETTNPIKTVAFQAVALTTRVDVKMHDVVIFDRVDLNKGGGYSPSTGVFTAPRSGIYIFHWTCLTKTGKYFRTELVVNGTLKVKNHAWSIGSSHWDNGSQTYIADLRAGDKVWIRTHHDENYLAGNSWSAFSGYRISGM